LFYVVILTLSKAEGEESLYSSFRDGAKRRTPQKINPKNLQKIHQPKQAIQETTLSTQSTTT
jgi:hypothetical protein